MRGVRSGVFIWDHRPIRHVRLVLLLFDLIHLTGPGCVVFPPRLRDHPRRWQHRSTRHRLGGQSSLEKRDASSGPPLSSWRTGYGRFWVNCPPRRFHLPGAGQIMPPIVRVHMSCTSWIPTREIIQYYSVSILFPSKRGIKSVRKPAPELGSGVCMAIRDTQDTTPVLTRPRPRPSSLRTACVDGAVGMAELGRAGGASLLGWGREDGSRPSGTDRFWQWQMRTRPSRANGPILNKTHTVLNDGGFRTVIMTGHCNTFGCCFIHRFLPSPF